jgi:MarR family transcriptional regulator, 2-MHQ and catechol-resistance regulon repressor
MKHSRQYGKKANLALGLWVKLARAHSSFARLSKRDIAQYGLTEPQFAVLECLGHCGPLKQCDLSRKMLVSGGNMTVVVDNLEKEGLVQRADDPHDRRAFNVTLTPKGRHLFADIFTRHVGFVTRTASVLTEKEQEELGRLLRKLGRQLQAGT